MSYLSFSSRWANYLTDKARLSPEKEIVLTYVIEVLVINLFNVFISLMVGMLLGVFPGTVAGLFTMALFRHTAGGAHSNSPLRCGVITIAVFPLIALLAEFLSTIKQPYVDILSFLAVLTGVVAILLLAPVDSPAAPIISPSRKKKLKILSLIFMLLLAVILIAQRQSSWAFARQIQLSIVFSIIWASFLLSKQGHQMFLLIDKMHLRKLVKGGE
ncbi:MAG: accessory gene regulator B family protein [Desulfotomaculaceae bacterium]|nr:accessory gene regulator B family protein [Desulfotomaculaceae bacterium]